MAESRPWSGSGAALGLDAPLSGTTAMLWQSPETYSTSTRRRGGDDTGGQTQRTCISRS